MQRSKFKQLKVPIFTVEADKTRDWKTRGLQNVKPSKPKTRVLKNTLKSNTEC